MKRDFQSRNSEATLLLFSLNFLDIVHFRLSFMIALRKEGFKVIALAPADEGRYILESHGFECIAINMSRVKANPLHEIFVLRTLFNTVRNIRPHILFLYSIKPNLYGSIAAKMYHIPYINVIPGLGYVFIHNNLRARFGRLLWRFALRNARHVLTLNDEDTFALIRGKYVNERNIFRIRGEGVDCTKYSPRYCTTEIVQSTETFVFLYIGRILKDKGIEDLINASRLVRKTRPHVIVQLLGMIDTQNPSRITVERVRTWEREGIVHYLGFLADVRDSICKSDCVVLPSFREGLSHALLEAAAMGKPLIASDVPGCRDIIQDQTTGYLIPVRDPKRLADAMMAMLSLSDVQRRDMGKKARERVLYLFSDDVICKQLMLLTNDILHQSSE